MGTLRVPILISVEEACALASLIQAGRAFYGSQKELNEGVEVRRELKARLAMSVAAEAKSKLWEALASLPEGDQLKDALMPMAWHLDDSDIAANQGDERYGRPESINELPPWADPSVIRQS